MDTFIKDLLVQAALSTIDSMIDHMASEGRFVGQGLPFPEEENTLAIISLFFESIVPVSRLN